MKIKRLSTLLCILSIASIFLALKSSDESLLIVFKNTWIDSLLSQFKTGNSIIFNLSVGFIISVFFYLLVVWLPNKGKKDIIKRNFMKQYRIFRENMIRIFLDACMPVYTSDLPSKLIEQSDFKEFFEQPDSKSRERWDSVRNGFDKNMLKDLLVELEIFMNEVTFVLNNVDVDDENVYSFFKRLSQTIYKLKNLTLDYDEEKQISGFLWELFAGWSFIEGYREDDIVKVMIEKI